MATVWKAPGVVVVALRQWSVAESEGAPDSSVRSQEIVTGSELFGTAGLCRTPVKIGATLAAAAELAAPGVPPAVAETAQP